MHVFVFDFALTTSPMTIPFKTRPFYTQFTVYPFRVCILIIVCYNIDQL